MSTSGPSCEAKVSFGKSVALGPFIFPYPFFAELVQVVEQYSENNYKSDPIPGMHVVEQLPSLLVCLAENDKYNEHSC